MATGYSTLYGDSAGGFAVIKDVPKTLVYELCRYRNTRAVLEGLPGPIPDSVLDKPPSAELRPDQRDDQSLPPYEELDPVLAGLRRARPHGGRAGGRGLRPGRGGPGRAPGRRGRVQAPPDAAGRAHHHQGLRQGPPHADHQPLPLLGRSRSPVAAEPTGPCAGGASTSWPALVGHYCWLERRIFELTGAWAGRGGPGRSPSGRPTGDAGCWWPAAPRWPPGPRHGLAPACGRAGARGGCRCGPGSTPAPWSGAPSDELAGRSTASGRWPMPRSAVGVLVGGRAALAGTRSTWPIWPRLTGHEAPVAEVLVEARPDCAGGDTGAGRSVVRNLGDGTECSAERRRSGDAFERGLSTTRAFSLLYAHLDSPITLSPQPRNARNGRQLP